MTQIDARSVVHESAKLADGVVVEPFAIIGANVTIGKNTVVRSMALVDRNTEIGEDCEICHGAAVGGDPQDLKYGGEETFLRIGDRTVIREFATINRGTGDGGTTVVGNEGLICAYAHIAHDCVVGDNVVLVNAVNVAGHVAIEDYAFIGGMTGVQQFVRIGAHCYIGGGCRVIKDVPPYFKVGGSPARPIEVNMIGLMRRGFAEEALSALRLSYRLLYLSDLNTTQALVRIREEVPETAEVTRLISFIESSSRGIIK